LFSEKYAISAGDLERSRVLDARGTHRRLPQRGPDSSLAMQLKASWLLAVAAANGGQALVVNRAGTLFMSAADNEAAKRAWLAKLEQPTWGPAVATSGSSAREMLCTSDEEGKRAYFTRRDAQQSDQAAPLKKQLALDAALEEVRRQRDELSRSIAVEEAEKGNTPVPLSMPHSPSYRVTDSVCCVRARASRHHSENPKRDAHARRAAQAHQ